MADPQEELLQALERAHSVTFLQHLRYEHEDGLIDFATECLSPDLDGAA